MERPTESGKLPDLANYGSAEMIAAQAALNNPSIYVPPVISAPVPANSSNTQPISMYAGFTPAGQPSGNLLSFARGATPGCFGIPVRCTVRADEVFFYWNAWR